MTHLGDRVTSLIDGELRGEAVERAHAHLASCPECRHLAEVERLMKARLVTAVVPDPSAEFVERLLAMGGPAGQLLPRREHVPRSARPVIWHPFRDESRRWRGRPRDRGSRRPSSRGTSRRPGGRRRSRHGLRLAVVLVGTATLLVLGAGGYGVVSSGNPASVRPTADTLIVDPGPLSTSIPSGVFPTIWQHSVSLDGTAEDATLGQ